VAARVVRGPFVHVVVIGHGRGCATTPPHHDTRTLRNCVLEYLLLDYMGWWALVCCGMSVHCVLWYLLLDYMGWWAPVCCGMSVHCAL
jgi:hypothetical protein